MPKADLLDGLILMAFNALRLPAAYPIILERIGDLGDDRKADNAHAAELIAANPQFPEDGVVSDHVRDHLLRDIGPVGAVSPIGRGRGTAAFILDTARMRNDAEGSGTVIALVRIVPQSVFPVPEICAEYPMWQVADLNAGARLCLKFLNQPRMRILAEGM